MEMDDIYKNNITITDIAKELGVSKSTVSRAISGKGRVGIQTREEVLRYIREHNYRPNVMAKALASHKTYNIGVVLPSDANMIVTPFFQACLMGICEVAATDNYDVIVITASEHDISDLKRVAENNKVDGFILTRSLMHDAAVEYLKESNIPFLMIGTNDDKRIVQIDTDYVTACAELTSILLKSGNRTIALLAGDQRHTVEKKRYEGYRKAFLDTAIPVREDLIFLNMNNQTLIDQTIERIMSNGGVDCIVCSDDLICTRVVAKLHKEHYRIPRNVRVASFYNSPILETYDSPITAVNINAKQLGIAAGDKMLKMIAKEAIIQKSLINYEIIIKNSTM